MYWNQINNHRKFDLVQAHMGLIADKNMSTLIILEFVILQAVSAITTWEYLTESGTLVSLMEYTYLLRGECERVLSASLFYST